MCRTHLQNLQELYYIHNNTHKDTHNSPLKGKTVDSSATLGGVGERVLFRCLTRPDSERPALLWPTGPIPPEAALVVELRVQVLARHLPVGSHDVVVVALELPDDVPVGLGLGVAAERHESLVRNLRGALRAATARQQEAHRS